MVKCFWSQYKSIKYSRIQFMILLCMSIQQTYIYSLSSVSWVLYLTPLTFSFIHQCHSCSSVMLYYPIHTHLPVFKLQYINSTESRTTSSQVPLITLTVLSTDCWNWHHIPPSLMLCILLSPPPPLLLLPLTLTLPSTVHSLDGLGSPMMSMSYRCCCPTLMTTSLTFVRSMRGLPVQENVQLQWRGSWKVIRYGKIYCEHRWTGKQERRQDKEMQWLIRAKMNCGYIWITYPTVSIVHLEAGREADTHQ